MPQIQLPIFPDSSSFINSELAFLRREQTVFYFNGHLPVFSHAVGDIGAFRLFTSQLITNGSASQGQIARAFGLSITTVKRACKMLKVRGPAGFFVPPVAREGLRLNAARLAEAQALLDEGFDVPSIAAKLGVLQNTLHKAIRAGRIKKKTFLVLS